ncbi:HutD/Ves family protein [Paenibacillus sp. TH7-28]
MKLIKKLDAPVSVWSGGTTVQMAIYPERASYARRDFAWRISLAEMTEPRTVFTSLPGYKRKLLATDGSFRLEHEGRRTAELRPYEQDCFEGEWTTRCTGMGKDVNLMLAGGWDGRLDVLRVEAGGAVKAEAPCLPAANKFECFYCEKGRLAIRTGERLSLELAEGEMLIWKPGSEQARQDLRLVHDGGVPEPCVLIRIAVWEQT